MRRFVTAFALVTVVVGLTAPVALAQRDPFEPAIETVDPGAGEAQPGSEATAAPATREERPETLADTGAESGPWLALSYALVALGVAALALERIGRPLFRR